ncbi:MAG: DUF1801 domain-containing protein [Bacteroidia bacterium]|nr:DUF1801 domain-containing protein [Bacteroidia bacterium]
MIAKKLLNEVDLYIAQFPQNVQLQLIKLREIILKAAPNATELINYKMPAYKQYEYLVYFDAYKNHIGFYPTSAGIKAFEKEFANYKYSKGAVQFPINEALPEDLIARIVKYRNAATIAKQENKKISKNKDSNQ